MLSPGMVSPRQLVLDEGPNLSTIQKTKVTSLGPVLGRFLFFPEQLIAVPHEFSLKYPHRYFVLPRVGRELCGPGCGPVPGCFSWL